MNSFQQIEKWGETHHPRWVDYIRIALGLFLIYKGIHFLANTGEIMGLVKSSIGSFTSFKTVMLAHLVVVLHIMGGILITIGLFTRLACLVQIPVLLTAVLFINFSSEIKQPNSEIIISIVTLFLLIYFLIVGNGPLSYEKMYHGDERKSKI
ncbi:MAG TPA: DoxX family protein [Ferruginibacter sp.]|nr:DoxX family protein [Ferruginibacter sp.]HRE64314.1 DoxX family protein [Ferruginibacter sp.]